MSAMTALDCPGTSEASVAGDEKIACRLVGAIANLPESEAAAAAKVSLFVVDWCSF